MMQKVTRGCLALVAGLSAATALKADPAAFNIKRVKHVIVIYQENWSFDGLYSQFPGADGYQGGRAVNQVDKAGAPLASLPQPVNNGAPDPRFPSSLPVDFYNLSQYVPDNQDTGDIIHRFYHEQLQIDGGKMDKFVAWSDNGGLVPSYYDASSLPEGQLARQYVMCDRGFHSAYGGSFLNHQWLIAAASPQWSNAPAALISNPDPAALNDNVVTPDGFAVNTCFTINTPHPASSTDPARLVPELTNPTIGDRLNDARVSWAWYSGGWNDAVAGHPDPLFQFHHQPFAYYANYADGTPGRAAHLKDEQDFISALQTRSLPHVSFIKPLGANNEHPGYADLQTGQQHVADLVNAVKNSPYWKDSLIIITYDENGGRWDHVAPPALDRWGAGTRVPFIVVSPFAKRGFVDHTQVETVSILKFIEERWNLRPLSSRDAAANAFSNVFNAHFEGWQHWDDSQNDKD